jgi:hypothetical protein
MMNWLCFSFVLPGGIPASARIRLWRQLRSAAAQQIAGLYVLPDRAECARLFEILMAEVAEVNGEAALLRTNRFEQVDEHVLIARFVAEREARYAAFSKSLERRRKLVVPAATDGRVLAGLQRQLVAIAASDYFDAPGRAAAQAKLNAYAVRRTKRDTRAPKLPDLDRVAAYRGRVWVTTPRPGPDALACAWLIRRYIDPNVLLRYATRARSGELSFASGHGLFAASDGLSAFERMIEAFRLNAPGLERMARLIAALEQGGRLREAEARGIALALRGWRLNANLSDAELEARSRVLFDGLIVALSMPR